ncbi:hypothetical protein PENTCL1PPCAC_27947, partial [Pristionchus entomophagus]
FSLNAQDFIAKHPFNNFLGSIFCDIRSVGKIREDSQRSFRHIIIIHVHTLEKILEDIVISQPLPNCAVVG